MKSVLGSGSSCAIIVDVLVIAQCQHVWEILRVTHVGAYVDHGRLKVHGGLRS